jgi:hypothetical protein
LIRCAVDSVCPTTTDPTIIGAMPKGFLTAEDKAAILGAPAGVTLVELACIRRRPRLTIAQFRSRVRRAGGWYTAVTLIACAACGRPLVSSYHRKARRGCGTARERARELARRRRARGVDDGPGADGAAAALNPKHAEPIATLPHEVAARHGLLPVDSSTSAAH